MSMLKAFNNKNKSKKKQCFRYQLRKEYHNKSGSIEYYYENFENWYSFTEEDAIEGLTKYCEEISEYYQIFTLHKLYKLVEVNLDANR